MLAASQTAPRIAFFVGIAAFLIYIFLKRARLQRKLIPLSEKQLDLLATALKVVGVIAALVFFFAPSDSTGGGVSVDCDYQFRQTVCEEYP